MSSTNQPTNTHTLSLLLIIANIETLLWLTLKIVERKFSSGSQYQAFMSVVQQYIPTKSACPLIPKKFTFYNNAKMFFSSSSNTSFLIIFNASKLSKKHKQKQPLSLNWNLSFKLSLFLQIYQKKCFFETNSNLFCAHPVFSLSYSLRYLKKNYFVKNIKQKTESKICQI